MKKVIIPDDVVLFNGICITNEIVNQINLLQAGGYFGLEVERKNFDNKVLYDTIAELDEVSSYLILIMEADKDERGKCFELLQSLSGIRRLIKSFEAPKNLNILRNE